jgi:uncharacterized protein (DUF924 family)
MPADAFAVLDFWFRELAPRQWFKTSARVDDTIRRRFGDLVEAALKGDLDAWAASPRGRLALILLLDQFTRNTRRGTAGAFAGDGRAQALVVEGLARGMDKPLNLVERHFFYMPLSHAEDAELQALSLEKFAAIQKEAQSLVKFARDHAATIERFGRFPSRNQTLGRASTAEEEAYLASAPGWARSQGRSDPR